MSVGVRFALLRALHTCVSTLAGLLLLVDVADVTNRGAIEECFKVVYSLTVLM